MGNNVMNQKEATYSAIRGYFNEKGISFEDGQVAAEKIDDEGKKVIVAMICAGFTSGSIEMTEESKVKYIGKDKELREYVSGLVNNWLRKDKRLNGGSKYAPKNPGSRTGSSDPQMKALRELKKTFAGDAVKSAEIDSAIEKRQSELAAEKAEKTIKAIDISKIPEELRKTLGL